MNKIDSKDLVIFRPQGSKINLEVRLTNETVWLSLNQIALVFERDKSAISRHLHNIFNTKKNYIKNQSLQNLQQLPQMEKHIKLNITTLTLFYQLVIALIPKEGHNSASGRLMS